MAGPQGILYALGEKPSTFSYLPAAVALSQLFARTQKVPSRNAKSSPFPEPVMFSLAKSIVETSFGAEEPSLLTNDFQFTAPLIGPLSKDEFVRQSNVAGIKAAFKDLKMDAYNFEIDQYDRDRVWFITKSKGKQTNSLIGPDGKIIKEVSEDPSFGVYVSAPEAVSVSINDKGLCYRVTNGYILDKEIGNTKGLGGSLGLLEAIGAGKSFLETRSLADVPRLLKEAISPTTSTIKDAAVAAPSPAVVAPAPAPAPKAPPAPAPAPVEKKVVVVKEEEKPVVSPAKPAPVVEQKPIVKAVTPTPAAPAVEKKPSAPTPPPPDKKPTPVENKIASAPVRPVSPAPAPAPVASQPKAPVGYSPPVFKIKSTVSQGSLFTSPAGTSKSVTPAVTASKPVTPAPAPAPAAVKKESTNASPPPGGFFSFLQSEKAPEPVKTLPKPAAKAPEPPKKVEPVKKDEPASKGGFFSFLDSSPAPATPVKPTPQPPKPAAKAPETPKKVEPVKPAATPTPTKKDESASKGGFFSFLDSKPAASPTPIKKAEPALKASEKKAAEVPVKAAAPDNKAIAIADAKKASEEKAQKEIEERAKKATADKAKRDAESQAKNEALARLMAKSLADDKAKREKKFDASALYEPATPRDIPLKSVAAAPAPAKQISTPPAAKQSSPPPAAKIAPSPSKAAPQKTFSGGSFFIDDAKPQMMPKIQDAKPKGDKGPSIKVGKKSSGRG